MSSIWLSSRAISSGDSEQQVHSLLICTAIKSTLSRLLISTALREPILHPPPFMSAVYLAICAWPKHPSTVRAQLEAFPRQVGHCCMTVRQNPRMGKALTPESRTCLGISLNQIHPKGPRPQPDFAVGLKSSAFTSDQFRKPGYQSTADGVIAEDQPGPRWANVPTLMIRI